MARPKNQELREFILRQVTDHEADIATYAARELGVTRASVNGYLRDLVTEGLLESSGKTRGRKYQLKTLDEFSLGLNLQESNEEDVVWRTKFSTRFSGLPENVIRICEYGFEEMLNNAIEHSDGKHCLIEYSRNYALITITIHDDGVGIFDKITRECKLADKHEAILELSKGKLTTDHTRHTGEGIFFTSRMFNRFCIFSGGLGFLRIRKDGEDFLVDTEVTPDDSTGTSVQMEIVTNATWTDKDIFDKYVDDNSRFSKTIVPLKLAKYEGEHLVSRSQARRIMARVEKFSEVWLDFNGIAEIGQPFADEIFRVWAGLHPTVNLTPFNYSADIERMIKHAKENASESPPST